VGWFIRTPDENSAPKGCARYSVSLLLITLLSLIAVSPQELVSVRASECDDGSFSSGVNVSLETG
jgi:hypothetical protein